MNCNKSCSIGVCIGVFISMIAAVAVGLLFFYGLIPYLFTTAIIALVLGVIILLLTIISLLVGGGGHLGNVTNCLCKNAAGLATGSIGTIVFSTILLKKHKRKLKFYSPNYFRCSTVHINF